MIFSYQEKILRCSNLIFHYIKTFFRSLNAVFGISRKSRSMHAFAKPHQHLKKTTFAYEKNRFHLERTLFSISMRIALERYL